MDRQPEIERLVKENENLKRILVLCLEQGIKYQDLGNGIEFLDHGCGCCSVSPNLCTEDKFFLEDFAQKNMMEKKQ